MSKTIYVLTEGAGDDRTPVAALSDKVLADSWQDLGSYRGVFPVEIDEPDLIKEITE